MAYPFKKNSIHKKTFPIFSMDYSNDGSDYALGFKDFSIRVYDGVKKVEKLKLGGYDDHKVTGHMSKIYAIKLLNGILKKKKNKKKVRNCIVINFLIILIQLKFLIGVEKVWQVLIN